MNNPINLLVGCLQILKMCTIILIWQVRLTLALVVNPNFVQNSRHNTLMFTRMTKFSGQFALIKTDRFSNLVKKSRCIRCKINNASLFNLSSISAFLIVCGAIMRLFCSICCPEKINRLKNYYCSPYLTIFRSL